MKSEDKDPKSHVSWCWKQKLGIKLEEVIENITPTQITKIRQKLTLIHMINFRLVI